jgi:hypothetical protein
MRPISLGFLALRRTVSVPRMPASTTAPPPEPSQQGKQAVAQACRDHDQPRLDAAAGCEFVDDRLRRRG